ncbi:MAG: hypothetical protein WEC84_04320 [Candidatus Andersenbacteria bacterium]
MSKNQRKKAAYKIVVKRGQEKKYTKLPGKLSDLGEGYKALVRELAKR